jgi:predicted GNAT family N-acyltransferase
VTDAPRFGYSIEPLNASHDRTAFHSGVPELDRYLHQQAGQDARRKAAAPFVMLDKSGAIVGYYTLSAYSISLAELPESLSKKLPRYPRLPATMLGRLAVSSSHRGQKLGRFLLMDALHRSWKVTAEVGSVGVVVEAMDESALAFYRHHEFHSLAGHPDKLFLAMATIEKALARV